MKMYPIEVDEKVWRYLQKHAEPFVDTPNSVLSRLLLDTSPQVPDKERASDVPPIPVEGTPKSLAQILEVIYQMEINGYSRTEATSRSSMPILGV